MKMQGSFAFRERNKCGTISLDFANAYELTVTNSHFKKNGEHLVRLKIGIVRTQINHFSIKLIGTIMCKDYKVTPSKGLVTQHKLLIIDLGIKTYKRKGNSIRKHKVVKLFENINVEGPQKQRDIDTMWKAMTQHIMD